MKTTTGGTPPTVGISGSGEPLEEPSSVVADISLRILTGATVSAQLYGYPWLASPVNLPGRKRRYHHTRHHEVPSDVLARVSALLQQAIALRKGGNIAGAMECFAQLLRDDPMNADVLYQYGKALIDGGDYAGAARVLETHLILRPDHVTALSRLAFTQYRSNNLDGAEASYRRVLALRGPYAPAFAPIAQMRYLQGAPDEGRRLMEQALESPEVDAESTVVRALLQLQRGNYREGFRGLEARWRMEQFDHPDWVGNPDDHWVEGPPDQRPVAVHAEEGFGDIIMMSRFVPILAAQVPETWFVVPPTLRRLMESLPGRIRVVDEDGMLPAGARHVGLMSLPGLLGVATPEDVPGVPYLLAADVAAPGRGPIKVGLVFAGGGGTVHDRDRSVADVGILSPLWTIPGVTWQSLQVGDRAHELDGTPVHQPPPFADFRETAACIAELDLVITVDTAVCHLAGAMGKPTWVMVPTVPEWRWMSARDSSPWYPSARLFRRERSHEWASCIADVEAALAAVTAAR